MRKFSIQLSLVTLLLGGFCLLIQLPSTESWFGEFGLLYGTGLIIAMGGWFATPFVGAAGAIMAIIFLFKESSKWLSVVCLIVSIIGVGLWGTAKHMEENRKQEALEDLNDTKYTTLEDLNETLEDVNETESTPLTRRQLRDNEFRKRLSVPANINESDIIGTLWKGEGIYRSMFWKFNANNTCEHLMPEKEYNEGVKPLVITGTWELVNTTLFQETIIKARNGVFVDKRTNNIYYLDNQLIIIGVNNADPRSIPDYVRREYYFYLVSTNIDDNVPQSPGGDELKAEPQE